jgi:hypothetical protein
MGAREQNRVISINARPSSWPIARRLWLRATRGVRAATDLDPNVGIAAHAAEPNDKISDSRLLATGFVRMTSNCASSTVSIQYP